LLPLLGCLSASPPAPVQTGGGDLHIDVTSVYVSRNASACGTTNPPFRPTDSLFMDVIGPDTQAPYPGVSLSIRQLTVAVGVPIDLELDAWAPYMGPVMVTNGNSTYVNTNDETGHSGDDLIELDFDRGADRTYLDAVAFDHATVTVVSMPAHDGDALTVRVQLHVTDGHTLDETYSGPVPALGTVGCPAG
jgi:hypothetical protein